MATINRTFGTKTAITLTLTSLGNGSARESTVVDNASAGALDVLVRILTKGQASSSALLDLYVYAALGDTTYTDGATGSDAAFTAANRLNSRYLGSVQMNAANAVSAMFSIAAAFGGVVPSKWGLIAINNSGATLSTLGGDHVVEYQNVTAAVT